MLVSIVRKAFQHIGIEQLGESDCLNVIRILKLDKLPASYVFMLSSLMPIIELIIKKLTNESVSFDNLIDLD
tara:strand:+ start:223 stop:438 length:216 start_codon:yes stop_codon:yes gene_type:complete